MLKRTSSGGTPKGKNQKNNLFNYFNKSPVTPKVEKESTNNNSPKDSVKKLPTEKIAASPPVAKPVHPHPEPDSDEESLSVIKKRRRIIVDSDCSDVENTEVNLASEEKDASASKKPRLDEKFTFKSKAISAELEEDDVPLKKSKSKTVDKSIKVEETFPDDDVKYIHESLDFLKPDKIKDAAGRRPNHPDYDYRTLYVPPAYFNTTTPAMRQYWTIKSQYFDCVIFYKVGKFYELYHMDATVGVQELGFSYMRGEFAHSGFPESAYDRMATNLVERGYKVVRVEQTETPEMMAERCRIEKTNSKNDKVVKREVCQVTVKGTQVYGQQSQMTLDYKNNYLLTICEQSHGSTSRYGICFIDTSIGEFHLSEFEDDKHRSRLLTFLSHNPPVLVLHSKQDLSERTTQILKNVLANVKKETLLNESQLWTAKKTLKVLNEKYFKEPEEWPLELKAFQDKDDSLGLTPELSSTLALRALGGSIWYLTKCLLDEQILGMARFIVYIPPDLSTVSQNDLEGQVAKQMLAANTNRHMILDSITISNLRIMGESCSLLLTLDHCCTKFGKRLLQYWVCSPSCNLTEIRQRQVAVTELLDDNGLLQDLRSMLGALPDLERNLAQIHSLGNKRRHTPSIHPDARAILYEELTYGKKKVLDFITTLNGFERLLSLPKLFVGCESSLLQQITQGGEHGQFPNMAAEILFFKNAFDHDQALKEGVIAPKHGVDDDYDEAEAKIKAINGELDDYLKTQEKYFGCRVSFFGTDKKRFQLEIPESNARKADSRYELQGSKKGSKPVKRYHTDLTKQLLAKMLTAENERKVVLKDLARRIFEKFSSHYDMWKKCTDLVAELDVLSSLAEYARNQNTTCVPDLVENDGNGPIFEVEHSYHPCIPAADVFVPNGIILGNTKAPLSILTGPNMGGKSTLMRQMGLLSVMAQIGCRIPAVSCKMSLIDRIFTRLGANDDIMGRQSTFLVELSETSAILKHATVNSLVLLDELGRGTATYDGTAIAGAVVNFLADLKCRALFSTHYHNLVDNFHNDKRVALGHMACLVENDDPNEDPTEEMVLFLYKYTGGACPKSYGFNAAKLGGMPHCIIKRAHELSKKVESIALHRKLLAKIITNANTTDIKDLISKVAECTF